MSNLFEVQALRKTSLFNSLVVEFIKLKCMDLKTFIEAIRKSEGIGMPLLQLSISLALKNRCITIATNRIFYVPLFSDFLKWVYGTFDRVKRRNENEFTYHS